MRNKETYISIDIEADGPAPSLFSMLSLGAAAFKQNELVGTFSANLEVLPGASEDPDTMKWWKTKPEAWEACRKDLQSPKEAMEQFKEWMYSYGNKPVLVAWPCGFDFTFLYWYMTKFLGKSPMFSCLDMRSFAMAKLGTGYRDCNKSRLPSAWMSHKNKMPHIAVEDAVFQGKMFMNMMKDTNEK